MPGMRNRREDVWLCVSLGRLAKASPHQPCLVGLLFTSRMGFEDGCRLGNRRRIWERDVHQHGWRGTPWLILLPYGLLHSSPISLEGGTSEKREMRTSNFNFEVGEMAAVFFSWSSFLSSAPHPPLPQPQISLQTF